MINTQHRSEQTEIMDDFEMSGATLIKTLDQISKINKFLGGNSISLNGVKQLLKNKPKKQTFTIIDLGCGNGDILRMLAHFGRQQGYTFKLIGIDANIHTLNYAKTLSNNYPEISYLQQDILADVFLNLSYDIALSTLFLHHFSDTEIIELLSKIQQKAKIGIVINDLHRHKLAYYLFKLVCLTINNPMVKNDGLISILKGFKKQELENFSKKIAGKSSIAWKWAFRYQWIINNN